MPLTPNERLGAYWVLAPIGEGGMGEVYRALDTRLGREVAIKVLPGALASEPERLARFQREARLLAALNHPNIATIHGFEQSDSGFPFLVLEMVEGQTLAEWASKPGLTLADKLDAARQIAEGLEAAHEQGIIHRDLKPSNVKITPDGRVKVLDFGLAKALAGEPFAEEQATAHPEHTRPGFAIGTAAYLSPEQARGKPLDRRTDIWSFGCVLFELLAGSSPFRRETPTDSIASALHDDPPWDRLPADTPARLRELLGRCLEKDARRRLRDIGDARLEIEGLLAQRQPSGAIPVQPPTQPLPVVTERPTRRITPRVVVLALVALAAGAALPIVGRGPRRLATAPLAPVPAASRPIRFAVTEPDLPYRVLGDEGSIAISPDGRSVVFSGQTPDGVQSLMLRRLDDLKARPVPIPDGGLAHDPFFSPDGMTLGYHGGDKMFKIALAGGPVEVMTRGLGVTKGVDWTSDGIVFSPNASAGLMRLPPGGGAPVKLTEPDVAKGEVSHRWPQVLPDRRHVLFTLKTADLLTFDEADIALLDLATGKWKVVLHGGFHARWMPTGHVVYARGGNLLAVPFDLAREAVTGPPVVVVEGVLTWPTSAVAAFAVAAEAGTLIYVPGGPSEERRELVWMDTSCRVEPVGAPIRNYFVPHVSPDGGRIAVSAFAATDAVFVRDLRGRTDTRVTFRSNAEFLTWMPDGRRFVFAADGSGAPGTYIAGAGGEGPERIAEGRLGEQVVSTPLDGQAALVYTRRGDLWLRRLTADGAPVNLTETPAAEEKLPHISSDRRWLLYSSDSSGTGEIYVRGFPAGKQIWQVSSGGADEGWWGGDGGSIFYFASDRSLMRVAISTAAGFAVERPVKLCSVPLGVGFLSPHPDGKRFAASRNIEPANQPDRILAVLNWLVELKAKAPLPRE